LRHRKKIIVAALLFLTGGYAILCFWPHSNPEAVQALAELRGMIQADESGEAPVLPIGNAPGRVLIECDVVIATINMTDATDGLFAKPGRVNDTVTIGRTEAKHELLEILRGTGVATIPSKPQVTMPPGGSASAAFGVEVPVIAPQTGGAAAPVVAYRNVGVEVTVTPNLTATRFVLEVECELAHAGRIRTIATPQGPMEVPDIHAITAKARSELKPGETLVIGGLSHKRPQKCVFKLPVLGDLPGAGSWFQFTREREIEEELVVLVTPRILNTDAHGGWFPPRADDPQISQIPQMESPRTARLFPSVESAKSVD